MFQTTCVFGHGEIYDTTAFTHRCPDDKFDEPSDTISTG